MTCFICEKPFTATKRAVPVAVWGIEVCDGCRTSNWDGIVAEMPWGQRLTAHLKIRGLEPKLNANGWIEWPNSN